MTSNCAANPVVQKRGKALGECLVWLVAGWPGTDPVIYAVGGEGNCSGQDCGKTLAFDLNGPMTTTWRAQFRKRIDRDWLMPTLEALLPSN